MNLNELKKQIARYAIDTLFDEGEIFDGMKIGLGTGSTAMPAVQRLGELLHEGRLKNIFAVPTSFQTSIECERLNIPVYSLSSAKINGELDLAIDGADEIDENKNLIKGGGAALLKEKIIAYNSKKFVVIADGRKKVKRLGEGFALPIEIIPEARVGIIRQLKKQNGEAVLREGVKKMGPVVTDNGNFILDVKWKDAAKIIPEESEVELNKITGVVENGFFTKVKPRVFLINEDGTIEDF